MFFIFTSNCFVVNKFFYTGVFLIFHYVFCFYLVAYKFYFTRINKILNYLHQRGTYDNIPGILVFLLFSFMYIFVCVCVYIGYPHRYHSLQKNLTGYFCLWVLKYLSQLKILLTEILSLICFLNDKDINITEIYRQICHYHMFG